jgi:hypothetical protein
MNERIKELAEQAGIKLPNNLVDGVNGPGVVTEKDKLEKFAELIVQECVNVLHDNELWSRDVSHVLHEHFGAK